MPSTSKSVVNNNDSLSLNSSIAESSPTPNTEWGLVKLRLFVKRSIKPNLPIDSIVDVFLFDMLKDNKRVWFEINKIIPRTKLTYLVGLITAYIQRGKTGLCSF